MTHAFELMLVVRGKGGPREKAKKPDPSGPNSVPDLMIAPAEVPSWQARCTDSVCRSSSQIVDVH